MLRVSHRWFGSILQLYIWKDPVILRVPKGKIQVLLPNWASYWERRAIGRR